MARHTWLVPALLLLPAIAHADPPPAPPPSAASPQAPPPAAQPYAYPYYYYYPPQTPYAAPPAPVPAPPKERVRIEPYNGGPVPEGAKVVTQRRNGLLAAGIATFASLYSISAIYAVVACPPGSSESSCRANTAWLYMPAIGPFITAADPKASFGGRNLAIFDGTFQTAGLVTIIATLALGHDVLEFHDAEPAAPRSPAARWTVVPSAPGAQAGLSLRVTSF